MGARHIESWFTRCSGRGFPLAALAAALLSAACGRPAPPAETHVHGVKLYLNQDNLQARYSSYDTLVSDLRSSGVNAVFTTLYEGTKAFYDSRILPGRDPAIDLKKLRESAAAQGVRFGAICQIFFDADTLASRPDLIPIDQHGDGTFVNWQKLVCPSDPAYRQYKLSIVREIAETVKPDVISLDFMRFPTTWEIIAPDTRPDAIRNYCFCDRCLTTFQQQASVTIPKTITTTPKKAEWILANHNAEWVKWKTGLITSFVAEASREVKALNPRTDVQVHVVPWTEATFNNGLLWNAAQDLTALANYVDVVSPMVYHKLIGRPTGYIRTLTAEFAAKTKKRVIPSIQMAQIVSEGDISADEFRQSLDDALQAPSSGTLIFHWGELRLDETASALRREKHDIFKAAANP